MAASAALSTPDAVPSEWIDGLRALGAISTPLRMQQQVLADARKAWAAGWLEVAAQAGWRTLDLFGAHPRAPDMRQDCKGLICMLRAIPSCGSM